MLRAMVVVVVEVGGRMVETAFVLTVEAAWAEGYVGRAEGCTDLGSADYTNIIYLFLYNYKALWSNG